MALPDPSPPGIRIAAVWTDAWRLLKERPQMLPLVCAVPFSLTLCQVAADRMAPTGSYRTWVLLLIGLLNGASIFTTAAAARLAWAQLRGESLAASAAWTQLAANLPSLVALGGLNALFVMGLQLCTPMLEQFAVTPRALALAPSEVALVSSASLGGGLIGFSIFVVVTGLVLAVVLPPFWVVYRLLLVTPLLGLDRSLGNAVRTSWVAMRGQTWPFLRLSTLGLGVAALAFAAASPAAIWLSWEATANVCGLLAAPIQVSLYVTYAVHVIDRGPQA